MRVISIDSWQWDKVWCYPSIVRWHHVLGFVVFEQLKAAKYSSYLLVPRNFKENLLNHCGGQKLKCPIMSLFCVVFTFLWKFPQLIAIIKLSLAPRKKWKCKCWDLKKHWKFQHFLYSKYTIPVFTFDFSLDMLLTK